MISEDTLDTRNTSQTSTPVVTCGAAPTTVYLQCVRYNDPEVIDDRTTPVPSIIPYYAGQVPREGDAVFTSDAAWEIRKVAWNLWASNGPTVMLYVSLKGV